MTVPIQHAYFVGTLPFLALWAVLFLWRKDERKEMLFVSIFVAIFSTITSYVWWTVDWWRPATITGTRIGIEDFILGFGVGGIVAVIYEAVLRKRHYKPNIKRNYLGGFSILFLIAFITAFLFWVAGLTSFWSSTIAMVVAAIIMFSFRRDLLVNGIVSGLLMAVISLSSYFFIIFLSPGWVQATYLFDTLSGILVLGIPIEEFVFWFLFGLVMGPFYEYWKGERLRKMRRI